jgi:hypothetical protein
MIIQARYWLIHLRLLVILSFRFLISTAALAVPIGLTIATARYSYSAFQELASLQSSSSDLFLARREFNYFIRGGTAFLALLPLFIITAMTTSRITIERDKQTWEVLLTTPLTGAEILSAKMRPMAWAFWRSTRWLIPIWLLGILCGSLHPWGAMLAAVELALAAWLALVLGAWLGVRPGSPLTIVASSPSTSASVGVLAISGPFVLLLLGSREELAEFGTWDLGLRVAVVAAVLAALALLGFTAWTLTRRTYRKFDEWVGRPHRG